VGAAFVGAAFVGAAFVGGAAAKSGCSRNVVKSKLANALIKIGIGTPANRFGEIVNDIQNAANTPKHAAPCCMSTHAAT